MQSNENKKNHGKLGFWEVSYYLQSINAAERMRPIETEQIPLMTALTLLNLR
jgi:hypothetical protein